MILEENCLKGFGVFFFKDKSRHLSKIISVLLSASVERFFVSRMQDFFTTIKLTLFFFKTNCKNAPGVSGAVLQTATDYLSDSPMVFLNIKKIQHIGDTEEKKMLQHIYNLFFKLKEGKVF